MDTINPDTPDIAGLPWVLFDERKTLPKASAMYFALTVDERLLYIGKTTNLRTRWYAHHKAASLTEAGCVRLAWMLCDPSIAGAIEHALIHYSSLQ